MKKKENGLGSRQLAMLALGTVVGGSFFLGSGVAIHAAGPSILIGFVFGGVLVYFILFALSEMTVANPDPGSFRTYASQAFGEGAGFVVGWVYWTGMVLAMSSEAAAVSILVRHWLPHIPIVLLGGGIIVGVTLLNLLGASKLSRLESGLASVKLFAIVSFILLAAALVTGLLSGRVTVGISILAGEPLMPGGFAGLAGSMLIVMFTYAGFEIIGLAASEADNPKDTVPRAIRYTVVSLVGLYVLSSAALLLLLPTDQIGQDTSPIVAALNESGIGWAGTAMNAVLITAILSTMLAAMFGLGRMMRSLAGEGSSAPLAQRRNRRALPRNPGVRACHAVSAFTGACLSAGLPVSDQLGRVRPFVFLSCHHGHPYPLPAKKRLPARREMPALGIPVYLAVCPAVSSCHHRQHAFRRGAIGGACGRERHRGLFCAVLLGGAGPPTQNGRAGPGLSARVVPNTEFSQELSDFYRNADRP